MHLNIKNRGQTTPPAKIIRIPEGSRGVAATLGIMRKLVRKFKTNMVIRQTAENLTNGLSQKDWGREITALHAYVRDSIRYLKDVNGVETLQYPTYTLSRRVGDCDDKSVLLASLLESIGHPTRFKAIGFAPGHYCHVYVETKLGNRWIPLETTEPVRPGWQPMGIISQMVRHN